MKFQEIIVKNRELEDCNNGSKYKITILSNIMVHQSKEICEYFLRMESINASVSLGGYDNIVQDSKKNQNQNDRLFKSVRISKYRRKNKS